jgi:hypothetical protein
VPDHFSGSGHSTTKRKSFWQVCRPSLVYVHDCCDRPFVYNPTAGTSASIPRFDKGASGRDKCAPKRSDRSTVHKRPTQVMTPAVVGRRSFQGAMTGGDCPALDCVIASIEYVDRTLSSVFIWPSHDMHSFADFSVSFTLKCFC